MHSFPSYKIILLYHKLSQFSICIPNKLYIKYTTHYTKKHPVFPQGVIYLRSYTLISATSYSKNHNKSFYNFLSLHNGIAHFTVKEWACGHILLIHCKTASYYIVFLCSFLSFYAILPQENHPQFPIPFLTFPTE